jgi:hypothetical protein
VLTISLSLTIPSFSDEALKQCDAALTSCDQVLKDKNEVIKKQDELLKKKQEQLDKLQDQSKNVLKQPPLWAGVGTIAVIAAGPVVAPVVIVVAIILQALF